MDTVVNPNYAATEMEAPIPTRREPTRRVKVKVRVKRNPINGAYTIKSSHDLPSVEMVVVSLPTKHKDYINGNVYYNGYSVLNLLGAVPYPQIRPKEWSLAIAKAIIANLQSPNDAETELAMSEPAFLSAGNRLYKLEMIDHLPTPIKALPALRRTVMENAKAEAQIIHDQGVRRKIELIEQGKAELNRMNAEAQTLHRSVEALRQEVNTTPPVWLRTLPYAMRYIQGRFIQVCLPIDFKIVEITYGYPPNNLRWEGVANAEPIEIPVWINLNCRDQIVDPDRAVYVFPPFGSLPHTGEAGSCMSIDGAQNYRIIDSAEQLQTWKQLLTAGMSGVNLSSLLCQPKTWNKAIWKFFPEDLANALKGATGPDMWQARVSALGSGQIEQGSTFTVPSRAQEDAEPQVVIEPIDGEIAEVEPEPDINI